MFIKIKLSQAIRGSVEGQTNVKSLLKALDEQFASSDKANTMTLIMKLTFLRLTTVTGVREHIMKMGVREHIMKMKDIVAQLRSLEMEISECFLVYFILNTLSVQYDPFKISYNTHKEK
jgi:gag-polypeptide of LTR copia-type